MAKALGLCAFLVLAWGAQAWSQQPKIFIGTLSGAARPDGFTVEDARSEATKKVAREQTYEKPFTFGRGPLAKYLRYFSDDELNIPPIDMLADRLVAQFGDKLKGRKLVVKEFSVAAETTDERATPNYRPPTGGNPVAATSTTVTGNPLVYAAAGPNGTIKLQLKLIAELGGKPLQGADTTAMFSRDAPDAQAKHIARMLDIAFYRFEQAEK